MNKQNKAARRIPRHTQNKVCPVCKQVVRVTMGIAVAHRRPFKKAIDQRPCRGSNNLVP